MRPASAHEKEPPVRPARALEKEPNARSASAVEKKADRYSEYPDPPPSYPFDDPPPRGAAVTDEAAAAGTVACPVDRADEGEFLHLQATREAGLELLGAISRVVRKKQTPAAMRARRLLARDVTVKERAEYIAFVAPDDVFLSLGEDSVVAVFDEVLAELGISKRARIERTEDDLYADDLKRAYELFGRDGVVPKPAVR